MQHPTTEVLDAGASPVAAGVVSNLTDDSDRAELVGQEGAVDPHLFRNPGKPTSNIGTLMSLVKGNVGIGVLAMPSVLVNAGMAVGTSGILLLGFVATYCMKELVDVSVYLAEKNPTLPCLNYPDTCGEAISAHPKLSRFASKFRLLVNIFIVTAQMMGCTAYLLFISTTVQSLVEDFAPIDLKIQLWELIVLAALLPYIQVRHLHLLSIFTTVANFCLLVSLVIIFQYVIRDRDIPFEDLDIFESQLSTYPLAFGTIIFAFEGINLVMPLRNKMKEPVAFDGWNGVLMLGMTIVAVLYAIMGFFGYLKVGPEFDGVLSDYIIKEIKTSQIAWLYAISIVFIVLQIFISYGLQLYVIIIATFPSIVGYFKWTQRQAFWGETAFRCILASITFAMAAAVPCLSEIFSLIGAFTGSSLCMLFPAIIDLVVFVPVYQTKGEKANMFWVITKNAIILTIGFAGFFIGTYTAIQQIVVKLSNGQCTQ